MFAIFYQTLFILILFATKEANVDLVPGDATWGPRLVVNRGVLGQVLLADKCTLANIAPDLLFSWLYCAPYNIKKSSVTRDGFFSRKVL